MKLKLKSFGNIHTILGILLAMLLVQTVSAETGFDNEVWISTSTNTADLGTLDNPYDGSTQANFDYRMNLLPTNTTIHLLAGTYQTLGNSSGGYSLKSGQKVLGSGIDNTVVKLVANAQGNGSYVYVMASVGDCSNNVVSDLTLDCNFNFQTIAHDGLILYGNHHAARSVKVVNSGGTTTSGSFGIVINAGSNQSEGNVVENCEIGPVLASDGFGIFFDGGANNWASGIIRDNHIFFAPTPSGHQSTAIVGLMRNTLIEGNYINGAVAGVFGNGSTGGSTNITVAHNVFENVGVPVFFNAVSVWNLTVCYNTISSTTSNGIAWAFRFDSTGSYTNIAIVGNTVTFNGNQPAQDGRQFLWVNNITGLIVANNMVEPGLGNSLSSCANVSIYNNYDLSGNFLTNLNQVASPNGITRKTVTYSGTRI